MSVNKLINRDNVIAIIGPSTTPATLAVMPVVPKQKSLLSAVRRATKSSSPLILDI
ncbi:MAG: hypothetical protein R2860_11235 [Desulfobacterales bacterium]